ncbi:kinesin-related protein 12-like [Helicoverpa zea]|uniref:kinesin-related protein 12-like n=1 Tax=Helicoverpa zea TaxID=7113 RepID=UPI001F569735|nr:kinesin-related protein 12-like [Helicoverpa zea]
MFKFGFKASLNFYNGSRKSKKERDDIGAISSVTGAYRTNRDEFFGHNYSETQRKSTPLNASVPNLDQPTPPMRKNKSTSDLVKNKNLPPNLRQENPGVSQDPRGAEQDIRSKNPPDSERKLDAQRRVEKQRLEEQKKIEKQRIEEQKKLDKQRAAEQKSREKLAQKEQAKQEKLRKESEKREAQEAKKNKTKKRVAPQPAANPLAQATASTSNNPLGQGSRQMAHSTNTLDSSISKSSGPPPYTDVQEGEKDSTGNVTYAKPIDTGSWDMISQHRENIKRPVNVGAAATKQKVMDLNYKMDDGNRENSEA